MGQIYPLDHVIRRVDCSRLQKTYSHSETLVVIDTKTKEVLTKKPMISFFQEFRCYLVSTQNSAESEIVDCKIKDIPTGRVISVNITYEASCESGKEDQVVQALVEGDHPGAALEKFIKQCIQEFVRLQKNNFVDFIKDYFTRKTELETHISQTVAKKIGLTLEVRLSLKDDNKIKPIQIKSEFFPVRVKDSSEELDLKIKEAMLQINEANKINIVATNYQEPELLLLMQEKVGVFLRENVTLHEFCYHLDANLRDRIVTYLNDELLLKRGRMITYLSLESNNAISLRTEESSLFKYKIECTIKGYSKSIYVEHDVLMNLSDLGKYKAARIDDLETWLKKKLEKITQTTLLEKGYADLILDFDKETNDKEKIENKIREIVKKEAELIGYSVKHLFFIPNLEPFYLKRDGISFDEKWSFETKDTRVKGSLSISVKAKIENFENIKHYLNPHTPLLEEIKGVIFEQAQFIIHNIEPERFYMRFNSGHDSNEIYVEQELREGIAKKLEEIFALTNITVNPKADQENDKLAIRFQKLQEGFHDFTVKTFPIREGGNEESITFNGQFRIWTVGQNGWHSFQLNNYQSKEAEIAAIRDLLEKDIKAELVGVPSDLIRYRDQNIQNKIKNIINHSIKLIYSQFGLEIEIVTIERLATTSEEIAAKYRISQEKRTLDSIKTGEEMAEKANRAQLSKLTELYEKEKELTTAGYADDDSAQEDIRKQIERIVGKNNHRYSIQPEINPQLEKLNYTRPADEDFSFEDHKNAQNKALLSEPAVKQISKDTEADIVPDVERNDK